MTLDGLRFDVKTPRGTVHDHVEAGRPAQRLQHPRGDRRRRCALDVPLDAIEAGIAGLPGVPGRFEVVSRADRRRHRRRRLRAHRRCAAQPARDGAAAVAEAADHGVRLRRRSRSLEAAADGHGRGAAERRRRDHVRQPAPRRSGAHHRRDRTRHSRPAARRRRARRRSSRWSIAPRRSSARCRLADAGDVVLIAGKGHEKYQQIGDRVLPFDDGEVARAALAQRRAAERRRADVAATDGADGGARSPRAIGRPAGRR